MKNLMRRALALMIVLIMLFTMIACGRDQDPTPTPDSGALTTQPTGGGDNKEPENPTPENPTPENPDPENPDPENPDPENPDPEPELKDPEELPEIEVSYPEEPVGSNFALVKDGVAQFVIVSRKNEYDALAEQLAADLTNRTGAVFVVKDKKASGENAIFIGWAPKNLMTDDLARLTYDGYVFRMVDSSLHITGYTKESVQNALNFLLESIPDGEMNNGKLSITMPGSFLKTYNPEYPMRDATLLGKKLSDFEIVLPKNYTVVEEFAVQDLIEKIGKATGYKLEFIKDSAKRTKAYCISFGNTAFLTTAELYQGLAKNSYHIKNNGNHIYIAYDNYLVGAEVAEGFVALLGEEFQSAIDLKKSFDYSQYRVEKNAQLISELGLQANKVVRIMTSNIVAPGDEDGQKNIEKKYGVTWQDRMRIQGEMILLYQPDFVGFQEMQEGIINGVKALGISEMKKVIGSEYEFVLYDEVPISAQHTPIAYRKNVWKLEEKNVSAALSSNNMHRWQWARFSLIEDPSIQYIVINLHYPISSMPEAREAAGKAVHDEFVRLKSLYPEIPISITGDFNASFGSSLYNLTIGADEEGIADTDLKTSYLATSDKLGGFASIDHVMIESEDVTVLNYRKVTTGLLHMTSDHRPVFVDVYIEKIIVPTPGPDIPWDDGVVQE